MKTFDEVYETIPSQGWLSRPEAELLWNSLQEIRGPILEVGCYFGRSTTLLANISRVYAVDPFDGFSGDYSGDRILRGLIDNLSHRNLLDRVTIFRSRIEDWLSQPVEAAYLDGDHTYAGTVTQIKRALQCCPSIIAVHDVNDSGDGREIKRACLEHLGEWTSRVERLAVWRLKESK